MTDTPNILELISTDKNELRGLTEQMAREADTWAEWGRHLAKIRRAHYLAYIEEGFTPEQALVLCQRFSV